MSGDLIERLRARADTYSYYCYHARADELREAADLIATLQAREAELVALARSAEQASALVIEEGGMPRAEPWRADGQPSKHDRCPHGRFMYEACGNCTDAALEPVLGAIRTTLSRTGEG